MSFHMRAMPTFMDRTQANLITLTHTHTHTPARLSATGELNFRVQHTHTHTHTQTQTHTLSFSHTHAHQHTAAIMANQHQSCRIGVPVAILLVATVGILLLSINTEDVKEPAQYMYGIVLDAGSSHTAMFIYKWPADKQNDTGIVSQHDECHVQGLGISSYASQRGGAARSLEHCMEQAMKVIPDTRHKATPLYLGATAGMRLLNISQPKESEEILKEVQEKMKSYPFHFKGATILTGQEEGAYGWVTVNYLLENFIKYGFVGHWLSPGKETVGALDFGGASTQITFETKDKVENKDNLMTLRLYGRNYSIYTQSFLCYGRDQMLLKLLVQLVKSQGTDKPLINPCYPMDYNMSITLDNLDSPCTNVNKSINRGKELKFVGSGNYQHCLGNMTQIFSFQSCSYTKCSFNGVFQPNVAGKFMAFSAFYYIYNFLQQATGITITSPKLLDQAAFTVCNMSFHEMLKLVPDQKNRLHDYCAATVFMQVLLLKGYKFDPEAFSHISFQKKAGDTSVGWALGYILNLSNLVPSESVFLRKALRPGAWSMLVFLFALLLILAVVFLLVIMCRKKKGNAAGI